MTASSTIEHVPYLRSPRWGNSDQNVLSYANSKNLPLELKIRSIWNQLTMKEAWYKESNYLDPSCTYMYMYWVEEIYICKYMPYRLSAFCVWNFGPEGSELSQFQTLPSELQIRSIWYQLNMKEIWCIKSHCLDHRLCNPSVLSVFWIRNFRLKGDELCLSGYSAFEVGILRAVRGTKGASHRTNTM